MNQAVLGKKIMPGATLGVVAPSSGFDVEQLQQGIATLQSMGYVLRCGQHIYERVGQYFAGTPQQRADDLHAMFRDPEIAAILCARGGYGCQTVLPLLDLDLIRANPKPIVGCSDVTALQLWLLQQCGIRSLHGPMVAGDFARVDGIDVGSWQAASTGMPKWTLDQADGLQVLRPGKVSGQLWGGCLSLLVSSLATPYELSPPQDAVLFLEDIAEKPYKIERMLWQLQQAGKLHHAKGIVFGEMLHCEQPNASYKLIEVLQRVMHPFAGPVAFGLRSGHVSRNNVTLPLGAQVELNCSDTATLTLQETVTTFG